MTEKITVKGLRQNNLKDINLTISKKKITTFTGVSGSGKSSIVFDAIAAEASAQMKETYPVFIRGKLPQVIRPDCDSIENLSPAVVIDQTPLGNNARSTVGTVTQIYSGLRLLFSRAGEPYAGSASFFSFNDPSGMCPKCAGLGEVTDVDIMKIIDMNKSLMDGAICDSMMKVGSWYWKQYANSGLFDKEKPLCQYSKEELDMLIYGKGIPEGSKLTGIYSLYRKRYITREETKMSTEKVNNIVTRELCSCCGGRRLNRRALSCWIDGYSIADLCDMELERLKPVLKRMDIPAMKPLIDNMTASVSRLIEMGLGYLSLSRSVDTLSGGESQRIKLVRFLGSSLSDMMYIFDEPSTGMHPRDVYRMNNLLQRLKDAGNTVIVVEHDEDVISASDEIVDVGPYAGKEGGNVVFQGSFEELLKADTVTAQAMRSRRKITKPEIVPSRFLKVENASIHNLKNVSVDIPMDCICTITGVAGSGKSSLMEVFRQRYESEAIMINQKPIKGNSRSTPASYLGFMDEIRREFAEANNVSEGMFSFNSEGACPHCRGKGEITIELAYMDPVITICEECNGLRYSNEALSYRYRGLAIDEVLGMTVSEAIDFFDNRKIQKKLFALKEVGLSYLTLGQSLSTLSGGERQRIKLATALSKRGSIYILDEPTTGLHMADTDKLMQLFRKLVKKGNSVILIEHNLEVMKMSDYIIDIGPDGGRKGGEVVFEGSPLEMIKESDTITARCLRLSNEGERYSEQQMDDIEEVFEEDNMRLYPIGRTETENGTYRIAVSRKYAEGLKGIEGFSHINVIWWADGCDNEDDRNSMINDKPYIAGPDQIGTFATRTPMRPNPIGISVAEIISINMEEGIIEVGYIDTEDGTPVLDIKPYTPSADRVNDAKVPSWCSHWPKSYEESGDFDWAKEFNFSNEVK